MYLAKTNMRRYVMKLLQELKEIFLVIPSKKEIYSQLKDHFKNTLSEETLLALTIKIWELFVSMKDKPFPDNAYHNLYYSRPKLYITKYEDMHELERSQYEFCFSMSTSFSIHNFLSKEYGKMCIYKIENPKNISLAYVSNCNN